MPYFSKYKIQFYIMPPVVNLKFMYANKDANQYDGSAGARFLIPRAAGAY